MNEKLCKNCKNKKSETDFEIRTDTNKKRGVCKICRLEQIRKWQNDNRQQTRTNQRSYILNPHGRAVSLFNSAKQRAIMRGEDFFLTLDNVKQGLALGKCQKTGIPFDLSMNYKKANGTTVNAFSPSIDKIDSKGIYEPSNVQYVCSWYNLAKRDFDDCFFITMCKKVASND